MMVSDRDRNVNKGKNNMLCSDEFLIWNVAYFWRLWSWCNRTPRSRDGRRCSRADTGARSSHCTAQTRPHTLASPRLASDTRNTISPTLQAQPKNVIIPPPLIGGGIKRCFCLTSVCLTSDVSLTSEVWRLSRIPGLSREQRGLGRPKVAQR